MTSIGRLKQRIDYRLNEYLCEMEPDCDDSIVGFNEAWNIVRGVFATEENDSHDALLEAAKEVLRVFADHDLVDVAPLVVRALQAAIAAAEDSKS